MWGWIGKGSLAAKSVRVTSLRTLLAVIGPPRSETKKYGVSGQSRRSCRSARSSSPRSGCAGRYRDGGEARRCTTLTPTPASFAVLMIPVPAARNCSMCASVSASTFGLPSVFPCSRARARPALTRSTMQLRSNSAKTPHIESIAFPAAVLESTCCWCK